VNAVGYDLTTMHDFYYSKLLKDPTKFHPRDGNKYVEFVVKHVGCSIPVRNGAADVLIIGWYC
jgi:hypothetical protein